MNGRARRASAARAGRPDATPAPRTRARPRRVQRRRPLRRDARLHVLVTVAAVVMLVGLTDAFVGRAGPMPQPASSATPAAAAATGALVPLPGAQSSAWFCDGGTAAGDNSAVTLELVNLAKHPVNATVSAALPGGGTRSVGLSLPARRQVGFDPARAGAGPWVAATVLTDGGGVGVAEVVSGRLGWSTMPCASTTSSHWYFAHGSTASGATLALCLYNPSATAAVVDLSLDSTTSGVVQPSAYQGIPLPPRTAVVENVGDQLADDASTGIEVSASSGTVVASELQTTPQTGGGGSSVLLGVPAPSRRWDLSLNVDPPGGSVVFHVLNPTDLAQTVTLTPVRSQDGIQPLSVSVAPHSVSDVMAEREAQFPAGAPYALTFSTTGPGVVVDRELAMPPGSPAPQISDVHAIAGASRSLLPAVAPPGTGAAALTVADTSSAPVTVTVERAADRTPLPGLEKRVLSPHRPLSVPVAPGSPIGRQPVLVAATGPVATQLDGAPGAVTMPAFTLP